MRPAASDAGGEFDVLAAVGGKVGGFKKSCGQAPAQTGGQEIGEEEESFKIQQEKEQNGEAEKEVKMEVISPVQQTVEGIRAQAAVLPKERLLEEAVAVLKNSFPKYTWVGIYFMDGTDELVLGPFLGKPSPHTRIRIDSGICGAAVRGKETVIVPDVNADPRYLACSIETKSEIVVPIMRDGKVFGEIDIDSDLPDAFDSEDKKLLEEIAGILAEKF